MVEIKEYGQSQHGRLKRTAREGRGDGSTSMTHTICLVNIVPSVNNNGLSHVPYNILYVGSELSRNGYRVELHHIDETDIAAKAREIAAASPLWVGISVLSGLTTLFSAQMSRALKELGDIPIVWGGHHPSMTAEQTLGQDYVDYVCLGAGEDFGVELSRALSGDGALAEVLGLGYKEDGETRINACRPFHKDIDRYRIDWSLVDWDRYVKRDDRGNPYVEVFSSRGCPFNCAFCSTREYSGVYWAGHSTDYILSTLSFCDDNVFLNKQRGFEILERVRRRDAYLDYINIRIDQLTDDVIDGFNASEVSSLFFGFESGVPRILQLMNKRITPEQILGTVDRLRSGRIKVVASGILGVPTETREEVYANIDFALKLWDRLPQGFVTLFRFMPLPGTDLTKLAMQNGFVLPERPDDWVRVDPQGPWYEMPWLKWAGPRDLENLCNTQSLIRDHLWKVDTRAVSRPSRIYNNFWCNINRARLKKQFFRGVAAQNRIERLAFRTLKGIKQVVRPESPRASSPPQPA